MATEKEVYDFIFSNYAVADEGGGTFSMQIDVGGSRTQKVYAGLHDGALQLSSPVVWANKVDAERVLAANSSMFGIVTVSGVYALKHNAFVADIDESEIANAFLKLAFYADDLESTLGFQDEF